jgi:hypothetical protein
MRTMWMKTVQAASLCALMVCGGQTFGQIRRQQPGSLGGRTPFRTVFTQVWTMTLPDPVKLIEVGQVTDTKRTNLLMLVGGTDVSDYRRRLLVTHWAGGQFTVDETQEFPGTTIDSLLVGKFRANTAMPPAPITPSPAATANGKPVKTPPKRKPVPAATSSQQIITTANVYTWENGHLKRLFTPPPNVRLALILEGTPDLVVGGEGNLAQAYVMGDTQADLFPGNPPSAGEGYVRFGVGTQDYEGAEDLKMALGVRYVQSYWNARNHWMIGISRPQNTALNASTDRLVVLTPRAGKTDLDFWATKPADMEETWRSEPFPGRILDVRIGDPRNDGKDGILVLTSEKNDKERHLYCFRPSQEIRGQ